MAKYIRKEVAEQKRGGPHEMWAKKIIKNANQTIRRLSRPYNIDRFIHLNNTKNITIQRISKNKRNQKMVNREKFGIKIPNSVKEALILDRQNNNTLWSDAMAKENGGTCKCKMFQILSTNIQSTQYIPIRATMDNIRRKAGGSLQESSVGRRGSCGRLKYV